MSLLLAISLCVPFVRVSLSKCNGTTIPALDVRDSIPSGDSRTLWDIIWSWAATLFACTWTAIHPNILGVDESQAAITFCRLFIMVVALTAPELIITWAVRQFFSARKAAKNFNDTFDVQLGQLQSSPRDESIWLIVPGAAGSKIRAWTVTHGFFAWMGGFLLYVNDEPRATLTPDKLWCFIRDGSVDMPAVAEADIEDRSKGDVLSKGIYGWWWKKPKVARCPYPIHRKNTYPEPRNLHYEYAIDIFLAAARLIPPHTGRSNAKLGAGGSYIMKLLYPFVTLMGVDPMISLGAVRSRRVPSLGGFAETHGGIVLLAGCFSGMVFGAIHCVGWNYFLHQHTEQVLWHVGGFPCDFMCTDTPLHLLLLRDPEMV